MTDRHSRLRGIQLAAAVGAALLALTGCNDTGSSGDKGDKDAGAQHKGQDKGQDKAPASGSPTASPSATASSGATSAPSSPGTGSTASPAPTASAGAIGGKSPSGARWTSNDKRVKVLQCANTDTTLSIDNTNSRGADLPLYVEVKIVSQTGEVIETDKAHAFAASGKTATKTIKMNYMNRASEVALCDVKAEVY